MRKRTGHSTQRLEAKVVDQLGGCQSLVLSVSPEAGGLRLLVGVVAAADQGA